MKKNIYIYILTAIFLSLGYLACSKNSTLPQTGMVRATVSGAGVVAGTVFLDSSCFASLVAVSVISDQQTVYRVDVSPGGTYQFQLKPGSYTLRAVTANNCYDQKTLQLTADQSLSIDLNVRQNLGYGNSQSSDAAKIKTDGVYSLCVQQSYGCNSVFYLGSGRLFVDQPSIYVYGQENLKFKLHLNFGEDNPVLAAAPIHGDEGWEGQIRGGRLWSRGASYSNFYYDARVTDEGLQKNKGFCNDPDSVIDQMASYLKNSGFNAVEIRDFTNYSSHHFLNSKKICVYPQESKEIDTVLNMNVEPKPDKQTRVWFVVVPQNKVTVNREGNKKITRVVDYNILGSWGEKPKMPRVVKITKSPLRNIAVSATKPLEIREWGLVFLTVSPTKTKFSGK